VSPSFEIARHRLRLAHDTLHEADALIAENRWRGALNRLYYAAFYAARAMLATRDLDSARHSGVIALFQQHFVKTDVVSSAIGKTLARSFETRQTSDYADVADLHEDDVRQLKADVVAFVAACERAVGQLIAVDQKPGRI
jgi:uncharacterized protein (UPF0332 family)